MELKTQPNPEHLAQAKPATHESPKTDYSTGSPEFVAFCALMAIHKQLQDLPQIHLSEVPQKNYEYALKDAIAVSAYLCKIITEALTPSFAPNPTDNE